MILRPTTATLAAAVALLVAACGMTPTAPALIDPTEIVTAALTSTAAAKSVHLAADVSGEATVALPIGGGTATALELTGTTAAADIDFVKPAAHATFALNAGLTINGEIIAVDGKTYLKSALTGPFYQESAVGAGLFQPSLVRDIVDTIGDLLLKPGVDLVKGADVACGSKQCYTVSAELTAADLEGAAAGAIDTLPVNLAGATLKLTIRVEKDAPSHIASLTAILSQADGSVLTVDITASKWDEPVTISAPPSDQVKPAS